MTILLFIPLLAPLTAAALTATIGWRRVSAWGTVIAAASILASGIALAGRDRDAPARQRRAPAAR